MRFTHLLIATLAFVATACGAPTSRIQPTDTVPTDGGPIQFNKAEVTAESRGCRETHGRCARVEVTSLVTTGGGTAAARDNIDLFLDHDLVSRMRGFLPEDVGRGIGSIDGLAAAFLAQFRAFVIEFPEASAGWTIEIAVNALHSTPMVVTLDIAESAYTGGAHPNARRRLVSFDVATGQLLGIDDLTTDGGALTDLVESRLRSDAGLEPDGDLSHAGFWIPEEGLALPDNVGVTADGLLFHWDAYEIAPYSMGSIDVEVAASELENILTLDYW